MQDISNISPGRIALRAYDTAGLVTWINGTQAIFINFSSPSAVGMTAVLADQGMKGYDTYSDILWPRSLHILISRITCVQAMNCERDSL